MTVIEKAEDSLIAAASLNDLRGDAHGGAAWRHIAKNNCIRSDSGTVAYADRPKELGAGADIDLVTENGRAATGILADRHLLHDHAVVADDCILMDDDPLRMGKRKPRSQSGGWGDVRMGGDAEQLMADSGGLPADRGERPAIVQVTSVGVNTRYQR